MLGYFPVSHNGEPQAPPALGTDSGYAFRLARGLRDPTEVVRFCMEGASAVMVRQLVWPPQLPSPSLTKHYLDFEVKKVLGERDRNSDTPAVS